MSGPPVDTQQEVSQVTIKIKSGDRATVRFLVDRLHVGTRDSSIEAEIRDRADRSDIAAPDGYVEALVHEALKIHHENRRLYAHVMGGQIR